MIKYKIAFAIHAIGEGGAERVITLLCTRFAEKGYDVHLITNKKSEWEYPVCHLVKRHVIGEDVSSIRPLASFQRIKRLRDLCYNEQFEVLVSFMSMNEYSVFATAGTHVKNIISLRNAVEVLYPNPIKRFFSILLLSLSSGAVFQTLEAKQWFPKRFQRKSMVIFNPIWNNFYNVDRHTEKGLLIAVGRLVPQKNFSMMIRAVAHVLKKHDVRLKIYGNGSGKERLQKEVEQLKLENYVKFCGQSDDVPSVLSKADIFLLSSDYEGMPNALMEAMAVGLPCVSTDCLGSGPKMLLGNNERGILVPRRNEEKFAEAIMLLINDSERKKRISDAAKKYANNFSADNCFMIWERYIYSFVTKE